MDWMPEAVGLVAMARVGAVDSGGRSGVAQGGCKVDALRESGTGLNTTSSRKI